MYTNGVHQISDQSDNNTMGNDASDAASINSISSTLSSKRLKLVSKEKINSYVKALLPKNETIKFDVQANNFQTIITANTSVTGILQLQKKTKLNSGSLKSLFEKLWEKITSEENVFLKEDERGFFQKTEGLFFAQPLYLFLINCFFRTRDPNKWRWCETELRIFLWFWWIESEKYHFFFGEYIEIWKKSSKTCVSLTITNDSKLQIYGFILFSAKLSSDPEKPQNAENLKEPSSKSQPNEQQDQVSQKTEKQQGEPLQNSQKLQAQKSQQQQPEKQYDQALSPEDTNFEQSHLYKEYGGLPDAIIDGNRASKLSSRKNNDSPEITTTPLSDLNQSNTNSDQGYGGLPEVIIDKSRSDNATVVSSTADTVPPGSIEQPAPFPDEIIR